MANYTNIFNDVVLTKIFRGYNPAEYEFIQDDVLPIMKIQTTTGELPSVGSNAQDWLRVLSSDLITEATGTPEIDSYVTKGTGWQTQRHGAKHKITRNDGQSWSQTDWRAGMRKAREYYTKLLKVNRLIAKEKALADTLFNATTFSSYSVTLTGADQFNVASSDPLGVARDARRSIEQNAHQEPNVCIIPYPVYDELIGHTQLKETHGVAPSGTVPVLDLTKEQLKRALKVDKILVPKVKYETAAKGATSSLGRIWGNYMMFMYVNPSPQPMKHQRSLGYTFQLTEGSMDWYEVDDPRDTQYVRYEEEYDQLVIDASAAYLVVNPIASGSFTIS